MLEEGYDCFPLFILWYWHIQIVTQHALFFVPLNFKQKTGQKTEDPKKIGICLWIITRGFKLKKNKAFSNQQAKPIHLHKYMLKW